MEPHTGGKWVIHGAKTPQGESFATPGALPLIIFNLVSIYDINEAHGILSNLFFKNEFRGQKHPRNVDKCIYIVQYIDYCILSKYCQHSVQDNQCPEKPGHHRLSLPQLHL